MRKALALTGALIVAGTAIVASNQKAREFVLDAVATAEQAGRNVAHKAKRLGTELSEAFVESGSPVEFINSAKAVLTQSK